MVVAASGSARILHSSPHWFPSAVAGIRYWSIYAAENVGQYWESGTEMDAEPAGLQSHIQVSRSCRCQKDSAGWRGGFQWKQTQTRGKLISVLSMSWIHHHKETLPWLAFSDNTPDNPPLFVSDAVTGSVGHHKASPDLSGLSNQTSPYAHGSLCFC